MKNAATVLLAFFLAMALASCDCDCDCEHLCCKPPVAPPAPPLKPRACLEPPAPVPQQPAQQPANASRHLPPAMPSQLSALPPLDRKKNDAQTESSLQRKVTFDLDDTPLQTAIAQLIVLGREAISIDPLIGANVKKHVTLKVEDMELGKALDELLKQADPSLTYVTDPMIVITLRPPADAR